MQQSVKRPAMMYTPDGRIVALEQNPRTTTVVDLNRLGQLCETFLYPGQQIMDGAAMNMYPRQDMMQQQQRQAQFMPQQVQLVRYPVIYPYQTMQQGAPMHMMQIAHQNMPQRMF
jgi:hypothetical protein